MFTAAVAWFACTFLGVLLGIFWPGLAHLTIPFFAIVGGAVFCGLRDRNPNHYDRD